MSEETLEADPDQNSTTTESGQKEAATSPEDDRVYLIPYPKVVFLYPSMIAALIAALVLTFFGGDPAADGAKIHSGVSIAFLGVFAINLIILTMDFPRATMLTLIFLVSTLVMGCVLAGIFFPDLSPWLRSLTFGIQPRASASFFWILGGSLVFMLLLAKIRVQFDYWEVRKNEVLHHHGLLSDLRRYPTAGLQIEKEINDVFEFLLLRSGRLILRAQGSPRDIVLENVAFIDRKESRVVKLLSSRRVEIHKTS